MLIDEAKLKSELEEVIHGFQKGLKKIRSGRATMDLFENITVEAYQTMNQLTAVSNVVIEDAMNVKINIWDKSIMANVEEALRDSNIGASVIMEGDHIRLRFSPLSEENRLESVKELKRILEDHKIKIRQIRHDFMKKVESQEGVSEDEQERDSKVIQKLIDDTIEKLDDLASNKEEALMSV